MGAEDRVAGGEQPDADGNRAGRSIGSGTRPAQGIGVRRRP
jgi:hypothetical protein